MVCPGDPERAADFARRAASVSLDGETIHGAQVVAAMEARAFVEPAMNRLIDTGLTLIPRDSPIARMIAEIREWHAREPGWRKARELIAGTYGYDAYPGNCHMVPNHAPIIHSLLYGDGALGTSLIIVDTSGWDTDCNSGNVGCLLGIRGGLAAFEGDRDWREPVADRRYLATADGGRATTDALTETFHVVNIGHALAGLTPLSPKDGARFNVELPGSVQGFQPADGSATASGRAPTGTRWSTSSTTIGHSQEAGSGSTCSKGACRARQSQCRWSSRKLSLNRRPAAVCRCWIYHVGITAFRSTTARDR